MLVLGVVDIVCVSTRHDEINNVGVEKCFWRSLPCGELLSLAEVLFHAEYNAFDKKLDVSIASPRVGIKILKIDTTECRILPD